MTLQKLLLPIILLLFAWPISAQTKPTVQSDAEKYFGDIVLVDQDGHDRRLFTDLMKDKVVVIQAFLSSCKSACPVINKRLQAVQDSVGERLGKDVQLLSITYDTKIDTPARLKQYANSSNARPGWYFLSGEQTNVDFALKKFGLFPENKEDHGTIVIVGNVRTGLWKKFLGTANTTEIIKVIESVMNDPGQ